MAILPFDFEITWEHLLGANGGTRRVTKSRVHPPVGMNEHNSMAIERVVSQVYCWGPKCGVDGPTDPRRKR